MDLLRGRLKSGV